MKSPNSHQHVDNTRATFVSTERTTMSETVGAFLHGQPILCVFLSIFLGTIIGRFHFKGVGFG
jgi:hypothetical protein